MTNYSFDPLRPSKHLTNPFSIRLLPHRDEAVSNLVVMQQQNDRLRDKYFRDLNDGTLTEHREKYPPWPLTDAAAAVKTKKTVTITADGNKVGNGWQVDHNIPINAPYAAEDSDIIYVDADIKRPKKNGKSGSRKSKQKEEVEQNNRKKISMGAVAGVSTSTKENHPYFYAYDKTGEAVEEEKYVNDVSRAPVAGVSTAGKEPNLQLFYNWDQETESWVRPGDASRTKNSSVKQPLDPNFVAGRKSVSGEVHPYNFGYDKYTYEEETKANTKHVDFNFIAGKKSVSGEVHPYNFSYVAQGDDEEKTKYVADPSFIAGKKSVSGEVHPYNFSYVAQGDCDTKTKTYVADPSFIAGKKSVSGEVHPYNFSYVASDVDSEEKTKAHVADPSFIAGKPTVQKEAIPTYFVYEPCDVSEAQETVGVKSSVVDPAFIAGKKTVTADRHPSNFAWDPYVATATDSEDAAASDAVNMLEENIPSKDAPPAGKSTRAAGAGAYPYYYAWNEQPTASMPPPPAVVSKVSKNQAIPASIPTVEHAQESGPAAESEECIGDDDNNYEMSFPPTTSEEPSLPTPATKAKAEAAKKKTRKASAAVNTSMNSSASSQVHYHTSLFCAETSHCHKHIFSS